MRKSIIMCDGCNKELTNDDFWLELEFKVTEGRPLLPDGIMYTNEKGFFKDLCQDCLRRVMIMVGQKEDFFEETNPVTMVKKE